MEVQETGGGSKNEGDPPKIKAATQHNENSELQGFLLFCQISI